MSNSTQPAQAGFVLYGCLLNKKRLPGMGRRENSGFRPAQQLASHDRGSDERHRETDELAWGQPLMRENRGRKDGRGRCALQQDARGDDLHLPDFAERHAG